MILVWCRRVQRPAIQRPMKIIEFLIASDIDGSFVLGSGGEFYALDKSERKQAVRFAVRTVNGRLPVYVNVGAVTTKESVTLASAACGRGGSCLFWWPSLLITFDLQPTNRFNITRKFAKA